MKESSIDKLALSTRQDKFSCTLIYLDNGLSFSLPGDVVL